MTGPLKLFQTTRLLLLLLLPLCAPFVAPGEASEAKVDFASDIYPILRRACFDCHGPLKQKGGLRLDERKVALGESEVIVPGHPEESELIRRVSLPRSDDEAMPSRGTPLSETEIQRLRTWVLEGAPWPEQLAPARHWSYLKPVRPALPRITDRTWPRSPIDHFVLARLEREALHPAREADRATLIRRLSLDLVGLPPAPAEVEAFLVDTAPDAIERLVDRLLDNPGFGQRWARPWLDLARYGDSHGFQRDDLRDLWAYRDWVINALNADMPFDQFSIEQLAGDLLPDATPSQRIATGFHRSAPTNVEAGSIPEETRINQVIDRVNTTATVWMGTTLACAQCHDHKYDPFTQRDYYQLLAFFNNTTIEADRSNPKVPSSIRFLGPAMPLEMEKEKAPRAAKSKPATTQVMQELDRPRTSHLFLRGDYRTPGEPVEPATPAFLHSPPDVPRNRVALARWLVDRENPLVARVTVNRWWAELFGQGLVATPEDFGLKGEPPTHPELLDWLAVEFMDGGWSMKRLLRTIVLSATYQQASQATPAERARDDRNRLLARGPRFRMDAEMIRDNALAIAGLLSLEPGGPPIRPFQPEGLWTKIGGEKVDYVVTPGTGRHRRGIYVVWKRAAPYPSFVNFDAPERMTCTVKRSRSNTPQMALTLLNDPAYVEAAEALARRVLAELPQADTKLRLRLAFRLCIARWPDADELRILRTLQMRQRAAGGAEFPAWYAVATVLLNLDETITKE
jgi:hypothetical protein